MRDLTMLELDAQLAEQLPARELMQTGFNIGAAAANLAHVGQSNRLGFAIGSHDTTAQTNASDLDQTAAASNLGDLTAAALRS